MSNDILDRYEQDGFVIIPNLITDEDCDKLRVEAEKIFKENAKSNASVYVHVAVASQLYREFAGDTRLVNILKLLMPNGVMFMSDKIVVKSADKTFATPWHIDYFYWQNTRPKLSVWIPLDDVNIDNGTLTVVRGSHKKDWMMIEKSLPNGEFVYQVGNHDWNDDDIVTCTVKRGAAVIFSDRLVHGSTPNVAATDRYVIISTYHAPAIDEPFDLDFPARRVIVPAS